MRRIADLFGPYRREVGGIVALVVVGASVGVVNPLLIKVVFDTALFPLGGGGPNLERLGWLVAVMVTLPVIGGALGLAILSSIAFSRIGDLAAQGETGAAALTEGYGDAFMVGSGIALLGIVTASLATWLIERIREVEEESGQVTRRDLAALTREVAALRDEIGRIGGG